MEQNEKVVGNAEELTYILPGRKFHSTWASPEAFARSIEEKDGSDCWTKNNAYKGEEREFSGATMPEAIRMAKEGWKEGAVKIELLRSRIQSLYPKAPTSQRYGVAGTTPNVPRAIAGARFNMRVPEEGKSKKKPVLTLVSNMCVNWSVDKDVISNRAAAVAALVDRIESEGYSVEVISTALTRGGWRGEEDYDAATSVIVKQSHHPVDLMRTAYGLGHASMFRRLVFADWQSEPSCQKGLGEGLGSARGSYSEEDLSKMAEKYIYFVPSAEGNAEMFSSDETTATKGLSFIINALRKQGCPAFAKMSQEEKEQISLVVDEDEDDDE